MGESLRKRKSSSFELIYDIRLNSGCSLLVRKNYFYESIDSFSHRKNYFCNGKNFLLEEKITSVTEIIFFGAGSIDPVAEKIIFGVRSIP